ncbi:MAG: macro domain-containing protein [Clostridiales bacterium]|nr:macro domain-containing protein [Clostridiales bacterium]
MPFTIVRQDITKMKVDAVVNAANTDLRMGGGVCGAIFHAAGAEDLQNACNKLSPIETGQAVLTPGFQLPAKYVIHAVGPVYHQDVALRCEEQLRSAYLESLKLALQHDCESIAFPLISSGIYGYPKKEALQVAVTAIRDFLDLYELDVYLAVFDKDALSVGEQLQGAVKQYIDDHYVETHIHPRRKLLDSEERALREPDASVSPYPSVIRPEKSAAKPSKPETDGQIKKSGARHPQPDDMETPICFAQQPPAGNLDDWMEHLDEPFTDTLLRLIDSKGKTDTEVYKRANIDRRLFSKIRSGNGYLPGKRTILALAIALELTLSETDDLLERAGYALSHSQKFDVIVEFFIVNGIYDIFQINEVLFEYDQPLLGSK